jgi:hypothetical protein
MRMDNHVLCFVAGDDAGQMKRCEDIAMPPTLTVSEQGLIASEPRSAPAKINR